MAEHTEIAWTDSTFNPWIGCLAISEGCKHCYAAAYAKRVGRDFATRTRTSEANWRTPLKWDKAHEAFFAEHGRRQRVFCASLADVFDNEVPAQWRGELWALIRETPSLDWLLLTKRIGNVNGMLPADWGNGYPNVWLGATVVNQEEADRDIPKLLATPARVRFLSVEPMLGPVNLHGMIVDEQGRRLIGAAHGIDWVICGGESGHGARPMHPDWARSLRDQCAAAGVPFLFKQHGEWIDADAPGVDMLGTENSPLHRWPDDRYSVRIGKKAAGRLLDGVQHDGFPEGWR